MAKITKTDTPSLAEITKLMRAHNTHYAPGSETTQWQDYVYDVYESYGTTPWDDDADEIHVSERFAQFWTDVAEGDDLRIVMDY